MRTISPVLLGVLLAPLAAAQEAPGGPATLALAHDLYLAALEEGDPVTVLAAARLAATVDLVPARPMPLDPASLTFPEPVAGQTGLTGPIVAPAPVALPAPGAPRDAALAVFPGTPPDSPVALPDAPTMLAEARRLAAADDMLMALIDSMGEAPIKATAVAWPSALGPNDTAIWQLGFAGAQAAELVLIGGADARLEVLVSDAEGATICAPSAWPDRAICTWTPAQDGPVHVTVRNAGDMAAGYVLLSN
jgi:hypothetical protein